ncbi:MAG: sigma 54-interacting transcriptional regulator [Acidobacteria bacterium]|nr:sigma 54-interacting transcriptional regulator [Acidobacteriota bacterium]
MKTRTPSEGETNERAGADDGVARFDDARRRTRLRPAANDPALAAELETARELLDCGRASEAETRLRQIVRAARYDDVLLARSRCLLAASLEMQGHHRDALNAVLVYESPQVCASLDAETAALVRVQLGLAYNYTGDHPKAIALLNSALREAESSNSSAQLGALYAALARVYRHISEYPIARGHSEHALEHFRNTGDWRGMAEAYSGIALAEVYEGRYEPALENNAQALKLVGDRPAAYLLGKIYANMAGACWFLKRPHEGIAYLEKAIDYYERTDHKTNAALGYNNLGINLLLVGDWARAQSVLDRALALATEVDESGAQVPMILDSLGQLQLLRGNLADARRNLTRAVELATRHGNKWYAGQALRTRGRCLLALGETDAALADAGEALALAERIGDRQAVCDSRLLLAKSQLRRGDAAEAEAELQKVAEQTNDSEADLAVAGEAQRLHGQVALAQHDSALAVHHFGRSVSIFSILGDRYRTALAHYGLGEAYRRVQPERSAEHFSRALHAFRELGAAPDVERAERALAALEIKPTQAERQEATALAQLLTLRLAEATASRELLLRELAAVVHQETDARRVVVAELEEDGTTKVTAAHGDAEADANAALAAALCAAKTEREREQAADDDDGVAVMLHPTNAPPAVLYVEPRAAATLHGGVPLDSLLRVAELGMNVCALRARVNSGRGAEVSSDLAGTSLMPGFIHSSPAMTSLVEEVHKIRSSDVTVLITGESGTGKELVARAIHSLSSRRAKIFVPFNCTAVPKELSDAYLFGYRRGSFTGATQDSPGVIRTAAGGTIFLDEVGDLPLDVQPKLLRFLQEGEIQPLGEQRPVKVDVRVIAATNTDLEKMVADGRFREDLYYRLNVIRLRVPPLRERRSEIPAIVNYYVNHYSAKFGRRDVQITPQAVDLLMVCDWPGNVRQLCNEIQRVVARAEDGVTISPDSLSPELQRIAASVTAPGASGAYPNVTPFASTPLGAPLQGGTLAEATAELERRMISEALRKHSGNISRAARELGLTRRGLYLKLERHSLKIASA